jgi:hypothetical protein
MAPKIEVTKNISKILKELSSAYSVTEEGRVSWPSDKIHNLTFGLIASLKFSPKIDDHAKDQCLWKTVNSCAKGRNFSQSYFLGVLRKEVAEFNSQRTKTFSVVTQLNVPRHRPFPKSIHSIYGAIEVRRQLRGWELDVAKDWRLEWRNYIDIHDNFLFLRSHFKSRNARSAIDLGYRNIQCCIGIMNLAVGGYGLSRRIGIPNVPMGKFLNASAYILSDAKDRHFGSWVTESFYPNFSLLEANSINLEELPPLMARWIRRIHNTDFEEKITTAIILFQEGLSAIHVEMALLKLWTCIELLCSRDGQRENTERIIEKASSLFDEQDTAKLRLSFIAESRHSVVHRGESGDHALLCAQWASIYAAQIIGFCVYNVHNLKKQNDVLDYLNTPRSAERLNRVISIHRKRLRIVKAK